MNTTATSGNNEQDNNNEHTRLLSSSNDHDTKHEEEGCFQYAWNWYEGQTHERPLVVKSITAGILLSIADLCAQGIEHLLGTNHDDHDHAVDAWRTVQFGVFGVVGAPWSHVYFQKLDQYLPPTAALSCRTFLKVFIDQFIQAPIMLVVMIVGLSLMGLEGWSGVVQDMKDNYWPSLVANWKLWITASFVNQAFVKPHLRVLFVNVVFFVWIIILSIILNRDS